MVKEINSIQQFAEPFTSNEFQSGLYEYVDDYVCIRARAKSGGLDHEPNVYISIRIFPDYDYLKNKDRISFNTYDGSPEVKDILGELESVIQQHLNTNNIYFDFKTMLDGGSCKFDCSIERTHNYEE